MLDFTRELVLKCFLILDGMYGNYLKNVFIEMLTYEDSEYTPEIIEKIWLALADKETHVEFLLSLYQFGRAKIVNFFGEYEVVLTSLQNADKASALADKYCIELLSAPVEIKPKM